MAKEWILNSAMNRFQLNFKRNVGPTSESIRNCSPKSLINWENYYYSNVRTKQHIEELGKKLYTKITEIIKYEVNDISEEDCINYMVQLVIDRTYEGYKTEIDTIYGQLENILSLKIKPASDEWDRKFNVDFYFEIQNSQNEIKYIGIQIKPINKNIQLPEIHKEYKLQETTHLKFTKMYGGKVFYIYSTKNSNGKKIIQNIEVIDEIKSEIEKLKQS